MSEFCLDCFNKYLSDKKLTEKDVILDIDLCEGCGEWKPCVITINKKNIYKRSIQNISDCFKRIIANIHK